MAALLFRVLIYVTLISIILAPNSRYTFERGVFYMGGDLRLLLKLEGGQISLLEPPHTFRESTM